MPTDVETYMKKILYYDLKWCKTMGYFNPYIDPFQHFISKQIPDYDGEAFKKYPRHSIVYDKLWVVQSQGLLGGKLEELKENRNVKMPIFIKPRWGHLSASSKNCFKIKSWEELEQYRHIPDMMWSEFIDATEQMTDYILLDGQIVHQITYVYSDSQNGFIDEWKMISSDNKPIPKITDWVKRHLHGFTGAVNVQYRDDKIIEVGLRLARGGAYILSTHNKYLIENINNVVNKNYWDPSLEDKCHFKRFYSFKCYSKIPVIYIFPQSFLDTIMKKYNCMPFYEYYFEPSGKTGMVTLQFMHSNFEEGMKAKEYFDFLILSAQILFVLLFITSFVLMKYNKKVGVVLLIFTLILYCTRFLNPLGVQYSQYKALKQQMIK
jgi:hypothetical protein